MRRDGTQRGNVAIARSAATSRCPMIMYVKCDATGAIHAPWIFKFTGLINSFNQIDK